MRSPCNTSYFANGLPTVPKAEGKAILGAKIACALMSHVQ